MTLYIVCRYNQARSIIAAAAIRKFYPGLTVVSSGVEASPNAFIPLSVHNIAAEWNLAIDETISTPFENVACNISDKDFIIAADEYVEAKIHQQVLPAQITTFAKIIKYTELSARDPASMAESRMRIELAKSVAAALLAAAQFTNISLTIRTVIPSSEESVPTARQKALAFAEKENYLIIDASLRVSDIAEWQAISPQVEKYDLSFFVHKNVSKLRVLAPAYEFSNVPSALMSREWFEFIRSYAKKTNVLVMAPSLDSLQNHPDLALTAAQGAILQI